MEIATDRGVRRDLRWILIAGLFLVLAAFLPWQSRKVDIQVNGPVPVAFDESQALQRDISSHVTNGDSDIRGYEVHKATPFGDGILFAVLGAAVALFAGVALKMRRTSIAAAAVVAIVMCLALLVAAYDALIQRNPPNDFSARDWYSVWDSSHAIIQTETTTGMFVMFVLVTAIAWHSVAFVRRIRHQHDLTRTFPVGSLNSVASHGNFPL